MAEAELRRRKHSEVRPQGGQVYNYIDFLIYWINCVSASFSLRTEESFGLIATTCFK
jgi:hypothetical protein